MGAVRPDVGAMVTSIIILSLRPVHPMRPDAQDAKWTFRDADADGSFSRDLIKDVAKPIGGPIAGVPLTEGAYLSVAAL